MSQGKKVRVLMAEDDPLVSEMIRGTLEDLGYTVVGEAIDGRQAVELTGVLQPDVILMDIEMPGVNGIEATQQIYETHPTPVVMLTAYETPTLVERASLAGVGAYLVKPPRARELERAIIIAMARFDDLMKLRRLNEELQAALAKVKMLSGLLPICASCKKIRDDKGYWQQVEVYIQDHSEAEFTHGFCPDCLAKLYPDYFLDPKGLKDF
jgi:AmiR/NasT family two-component response regulator